MTTERGIDFQMSSTAGGKPRKGIETLLGVTPHRRSVSMLLEGGAKVPIRVGFRPKDDLFHTSLIIIR